MTTGKRNPNKEERRKTLASHWVPLPSHTSLTSQEVPEAVNFYVHGICGNFANKGPSSQSYGFSSSHV